ncbi:MAG: hypothetical protein NUW37_04415 [Planctomycetes bacterium]|nr:hypothetical protein [Planctomycetota bacterium]
MVDYLNFDKVLDELEVDEEELKRMVSEGQIRAYRDEDRMKFRKDDIDALRTKNVSEPTIILPSAGSIGSVLNDDDDDLLLIEEEDDTGDTRVDLPDDLGDDDFDAADATVVPTLDFDLDGDSNSETLTEELVFDNDVDDTLGPDDVGGMATQRIESQATFVDDEDEEEEEEEDFSTQQIGDDDEEDEDDDDDLAKTIAAPKKSTLARKSTLGKTSASGRASKRLQAADVRSKGGLPGGYERIGAIWTIIMVLSSIPLFWAGLMFVDLFSGSLGGISKAVVEPVAENVNNEKLIIVGAAATADGGAVGGQGSAGTSYGQPLPHNDIAEDSFGN